MTCRLTCFCLLSLNDVSLKGTSFCLLSLNDVSLKGTSFCLLSLNDICRLKELDLIIFFFSFSSPNQPVNFVFICSSGFILSLESFVRL